VKILVIRDYFHKMFLQIHPQNPESRKIKMVNEVLQNDGIIIYPTDTIYGLGCSIGSHKALEKIYKIKGVQPGKNLLLTLICEDISQISEYVMSIDNSLFRMMKQCLPGPYTFILSAGKQTPKILLNKRKQIGIRVPDNKICKAILEEQGKPILSTSIHNTDKVLDYFTDPEEIYAIYENKIDLMIDGGTGGKVPSTVLDCTNKKIQLVRKGLGNTDFLEIEE
jgi:tRNA threonylcarbamoyl adenosine modification protein (Sua5/YciO/YrdC/YwlC family)